MVQQHVNPLQQQGDWSRENNWAPRNERPFIETPQDNRVGIQQPVHQRCMTIDSALRECASIPVKEYALIAVLDNGEERVYSSAAVLGYRDRIFNAEVKHNFHRAVRKGTGVRGYANNAYSQEGFYSEFDEQDRKGSGSDYSRHRHSRKSRSDDSDDNLTVGQLKRKRPRGPRYREHSDDTPIPVVKTQQLKIGDSAQVEEFYKLRFKDMQQSSCKVMGKVFVKLVEPKKQTHHPYTKGNEKAPPWWPKTTGDDCVRHKEPDHLLKPERILLLVHILKMIIEPQKYQHSAIQKLELNVKKLEDATMEAMAPWFNDKEHPENQNKRAYLKEIFKIAKAEERYKNGEIDDTTYIPVTFGDRGANSGGDMSDDEGDVNSFKGEEEEHDMPSTSLATPDSIASATMQTHVQSDTEARRLPIQVRHNTQPAGEHPFDQTNYFNRGMRYMQAQEMQSPRQQFVSPTTYQSPQEMYPPQWMVTQSSTPPSYYTTSPHPQSASNITSFSQLPPLTQQNNMLPHPQSQHFDTIPTGRPYESAAGNGLRTGSIGHPHQIHGGGYDYLSHDVGSGGYVQNEDIKDHSLHHQS